MPQEIDIAVVKATAAQFHVVPKEKHVRSKFTKRFIAFNSRHKRTLTHTSSLTLLALSFLSLIA